MNQFNADDPNSFYSGTVMQYGQVDEKTYPEFIDTMKEFSRRLKEANKICDDMDKRYDAMADAEAYLIQKVIVLPISDDYGWELTKVNDYTKAKAAYGCMYTRYVDWETDSRGYTTEEYEKFKD